jgi:hypothetical protein
MSRSNAAKKIENLTQLIGAIRHENCSWKTGYDFGADALPFVEINETFL